MNAVDPDGPGERLPGGSVNQVFLRGGLIHRTAGAWTPTVHRLMRHLSDQGFGFCPEVVGMADERTELLRPIVGRPSSRPWPEVVRSDDGLRQIGRMLGQLASAMAGFEQSERDVWRTRDLPVRRVAESLVLRHGDVGPWNMIWQEDRLVGLIDWDMAEPAPPLWDIAQAAWYCVPFYGGPERWPECGFGEPPDLRARFAVLCDAFDPDVDPARVYDAMFEVIERERELMLGLGRDGIAPYCDFLARGDLEELDAEQDRLRALRHVVVPR